ncbi:MAG: helix-turn-helix transcriptional regulator [Xanthomonadales bacterium]|nr:helix-turn-helix transcriptional regulator [Xanthomonadales bacterium]
MLRYKLKERIADLEFRERRRVTLQEIADATALNRMTLSKMANHHGANIQTDALDRLCSYFGCRIEELVEHVEQDADAISPR